MRPSTLSSVAVLAAHAMAAPQLVLPSGHLSSTIAAATSAVVDPKAKVSTADLWGPAPTEAAVADPTEQDVFPSVKTLAPTLPVVLGQKFAHSAKTTSTNTNTPVIAGGKPKSTHVPEAPNMANVPGTSPRAFHCKLEGCFYDDDGSKVANVARAVHEVMATETHTVPVAPGATAAPENDDDKHFTLQARIANGTLTVDAVGGHPSLFSIISAMAAAASPTPFEGHPPQ
ncbi:hypothetical protein CB0940_06489 [Cercospora beticola]|uniref:Uncharacterized protein n=1 Tax=Cercospora beticola TaxID=122368 RepID=A0A2G5HZ64_CERBT|nr:hypothetical protein CB0940_06489 [Cercospora beticola]PIA97837.1 hypothetical protein CB0940_06489 [Cercospora beticola]WPA99126.1 hypothetical protein RHO25_003742 [Cercospora beticola]CAK1360437.1 unnamed protein product [Cercospora beticola]